MSKTIENLCKRLNLQIDDLSYDHTEPNGYWKLRLKNGEYYETSSANGMVFAIEQMCQEKMKM